MDLYLGNATGQHWDFYYRLPEKKSALHEIIPMGEQIKISGDLTPDEVAAIVHQGEKYGLTSVDTIDQGSTMFRGLCYQVGKEISSSKIEKLFHANQNVLVLRGQEMRKVAAIVETNRMVRDNQKYDLPNIRKTEFSVQDEDGAWADGYRTEIDTGTARPSKRRKG